LALQQFKADPATLDLATATLLALSAEPLPPAASYFIRVSLREGPAEATPLGILAARRATLPPIALNKLIKLVDIGKEEFPDVWQQFFADVVGREGRGFPRATELPFCDEATAPEAGPGQARRGDSDVHPPGAQGHPAGSSTY
ncbi:hypothetical protein HK405_015799, partial [Cladochytrium tenue]